MDRSFTQKINKEIVATLDKINLIDIYRTVHLKTAEYTFFFPSAHGKFSRVDQFLGHKTSVYKFKKIEIILSIFSEHSGMELEINYRKKTGKNTNTCRLNNMLLNNQWIEEKIGKSKTILN